MMILRPKRFYLLIAATLTVLFSQNTFSKNSSWEKVAFQRGIKVWKKGEKNSSILSFKGEVVIHSSIHEVFSVLFDPYHKKEFIQNCTEFDVLEFKGLPNSSTSYVRISNNIPLIDDRDVVLKSRVVFFPKQKTIKVHFKKASNDTALKPKRKGIVRIPKLEGFWDLKAIEVKGKHKTKITYQVTSNPGGVIPIWLVNLANKELPYRTLNKLRRLVGQKIKFAKTRKVVKYLFDFSPFFNTRLPSLERNDQEKSEVKASLIAEFKKSCRQGIKEACQMVKPFTLL
tara:strand:+ start:536 stop:1390 length:855 start_codon:yes stop_codon:yes gene_type:complete